MVCVFIRVNRAKPGFVHAYPFVSPDGFQVQRGSAQLLPDIAEWYVLRDRELLVPAVPNGDVSIATTTIGALPSSALGLTCAAVQVFGTLHGMPVVAAAVSANVPPPSGYTWANLRALYGKLDDTRLSLAGRAAQLLESETCQAFCGRCGAATKPGELGGRICTQCGLTVFSRIEPAVIVAVTRPPNKILLARGSRFASGFFSALAGFVEPGETLEQCAKREVFEETAIRIRNLRYLGSQPWPFPRSLMVGFLAEYESGTITLDPQELEAADWFSVDALPQPPMTLSIARWLIDNAVAELLARQP
jgi:NAD+ diphosphatase